MLSLSGWLLSPLLRLFRDRGLNLVVTVVPSALVASLTGASFARHEEEEEEEEEAVVVLQGLRIIHQP